MKNGLGPVRYDPMAFRRIRRERALTLRGLAELSRLSVRSVSNIDSGRHVPLVSTLTKLANALKADIREFFKAA